MTVAPARNDPCPCGSGKRFKECHGRIATQASSAGEDGRRRALQLMPAALAAQQARRLDEAERLYRSALDLAPAEPDALHMLGVIRFERGDLAEARALIVRALDATDWKIPSYRHNLGLVLAHEDGGEADAHLLVLRERYREWHVARRARRAPATPLVSVVVPVFNHARFVLRSLRSIFAQSYRNVELIVIDDGSTDASAAIVRGALRDAPFPQRFVTRENRGAAATLNEGVGDAAGAFVGIVNSDDAWHPDRLARMVAEVAGTGEAWGFSGVTFVDAADAAIDPFLHPRVYGLTCGLAAAPFRETIGFALLAENLAISTGNLFFSRALFTRLRGFRDFRYNHDWDFALRALAVAEPVFVRDALYSYRFHDANTINESNAQARAEALRACRDYVTWATGDAVPESPFAPAIANWGRYFLNALLAAGMTGVLDTATLRALVLGSARAATAPAAVADKRA